MKAAKPTALITLALGSAAVLGALSDTLLAALFGAGRVMDAFVIALFIPLLLQEYVLGDSFTQVFIPVFSDLLVNKHVEEAARVASTVINALLLFFGAAVVLAILLAPTIVGLLVPGFEPAGRDLAATLTRIVMPIVVFTVLVSFMGSVLNATQRFGLPSLVQAVYKLLFIAATLTLGRWYGVTGLAVGVLIAGFGQALFLLPQLRSVGLGYRLVLDLRHPAVRQMGRLLVPMLIRLVVAQSYLVAERMIASGLAVGSIAAMSYARKLFQLPPYTFGVALNTVLFPTLSRQVAAGQEAALARTLVRGLRALLLVMAPVSVLMIALAQPIVQLMYQRGAFDAEAATTTAGVLSVLSLGMVALPAMWLINLGFFALKDTTTPLWITFGLTLPVVGLNVLLAERLGINGLALGWVILRILQFGVSLALLRRKLGRALAPGALPLLSLRPVLEVGLKVGLACAALIVVVSAVGHGPWAAGNGIAGQIASLAVMSGLGGGVYLAVVTALQVEEVGLLAASFQRKAHSLKCAPRLTIHSLRSINETAINKTAINKTVEGGK